MKKIIHFVSLISTFLGIGYFMYLNRLDISYLMDEESSLKNTRAYKNALKNGRLWNPLNGSKEVTSVEPPITVSITNENEAIILPENIEASTSTITIINTGTPTIIDTPSNITPTAPDFGITMEPLYPKVPSIDDIEHVNFTNNDLKNVLPNTPEKKLLAKLTYKLAVLKEKLKVFQHEENITTTSSTVENVGPHREMLKNQLSKNQEIIKKIDVGLAELKKFEEFELSKLKPQIEEVDHNYSILQDKIKLLFHETNAYWVQFSKKTVNIITVMFIISLGIFYFLTPNITYYLKKGVEYFMLFLKGSDYVIPNPQPTNNEKITAVLKTLPKIYSVSSVALKMARKLKKGKKF